MLLFCGRETKIVQVFDAGLQLRSPDVGEEIESPVREELEGAYLADFAPVGSVRAEAEEGVAVTHEGRGGGFRASEENLVMGGETLLDSLPATHNKCFSIPKADCENRAVSVGEDA